MIRATRLSRLAATAACAALATAAATAHAALPQQGGKADLLSQANVEIDGAAASDTSGSSVAGAGDVNGDGIGDVIVGAPTARNNGRNGSGSAYVLFGRRTPTRIDLASLGSNGFRIDGSDPNDGAGRSVAGAGDVNGDGLSDVIVGAQQADNNGRSDSGSAYVVFGKASTSRVDLQTFDGNQTTGFRIDGAASGDFAGFRVAGVGDMNGDGKEDVIVGAPDAGNHARSQSGSAYVVFGEDSGAAVDLSTFTGSQTTGFRIDGAAATDFAGRVAGAGDVNGDGHRDVIVGSFGAGNNSRSGSGSAYVVFGTGTASPPNVDLADFTGSQTTGFRIDGASAGDEAAEVGGAGDVDGDGLSDVIVGAPAATENGRAGSGAAYVVFGTGTASPPNVDLADFTGSQPNGFRIDGAAASDDSGAAVDGAGDVNGDGRSDVIVGAPSATENGRAGSGAAYVVFGTATASPPNVDLHSFDGTQTTGFRIDGAAATDEAGGAVAGAGDINGDGHPDVLVGAPNASRFDRASSGAAFGIFGFGPSSGPAGGGGGGATTTTAPPTGGGGGTTAVKPLLTLSAPASERLARQKAVIFTVRSDVAASLLAGGTITIGRKAFRLPKVSRALSANASTKVKLKLSPKLVRSIRQALAHHKKVVARVKATASDSAGATTVARKVRGRR